MKGYLPNKFAVQGVVKPGSSTDILTLTASEDINNLTQSDVLIFWGGANDVGKNNSVNGLRNIVNFIQSNNHTNIILLSVLRHVDLMKSSCVNEEISKFNRKLGKLVKHLKHVSFVKLADNRELFTQHGACFNNSKYVSI